MSGLRAAEDRDSWALIALIAACWAEYPGCVTDVAGEYPELLAPASHYRHLGGSLWVLPEGAWIAASVGFCPGPETTKGQPAELVKLYVAPHWRGRGLGRALVDRVEQEARARHVPGVELWSDTRFHAAHRLYQRLGYLATGATRDLHDRSHTTEYHFAKVLSADPMGPAD